MEFQIGSQIGRAGPQSRPLTVTSSSTTARPLHHLVASTPRYSTDFFQSDLHSSTSYSNSLPAATSRSPDRGYDYTSSDTEQYRDSLTKTFSTSDSFCVRAISAFSDAVKTGSSTPQVLSAQTSFQTRAKSIAGPMLARTASMRLGGLLNRTPTQKRTTDEIEPIDEAEDILEYKPTLTMTPERSSRVGTPRTQPSARPATLVDRFAWFAQSKTDDGFDTPSRPHDALELSDPLLSLNINASLFPHGNIDSTSPNAFDDLLRHSTALINRLQAGYREKTTLLRAAYDERDATSEESSEATTRAEHLRSQLEAMAARAAEQDRAMQALADQLSSERQARDELAAELSHFRQQQQHLSEASDENDLVTPRRAPHTAHQAQTPRRLRSSPRTSDGDSVASGFESDADCDSTVASTYSGSSSNAYSLDSASTMGTPVTPGSSVAGGSHHQDFEWDAPKRGPVEIERKPVLGNHMSGGTMGGAWGIVGELQRENAKLKGRVRDLEGAVEGVLSMVG